MQLPNEILITRGDDWHYSLYFTNWEDFPLDLSTYLDFDMEIRTSPSRKGKLLTTLQLGSGIDISGADNNILDLVVSRTFTADWSAGKYYFDLRALDDDNKLHTLVWGEIRVRENITQ